MSTFRLSIQSATLVARRSVPGNPREFAKVSERAGFLLESFHKEMEQNVPRPSADADAVRGDSPVEQ